MAMMRIVTAFLLLSAASAHLKVSSVFARNTTSVALQAELMALADECKCSFKGQCECYGATEFVNCISDACDSGKCDCGDHGFHFACEQMGAACQSIEMHCEKDRATCTGVTNPK
eukprot:gnl/TRDRNA2_/TRDRNA2_132549_c0_seq1.p1 gnl/TRDRNA2_/TRDRNA2_132549_c0~~gnl/TRDRNA2_/TRDRNA2_132549_c0_seq1.p1  ORF type:complete len:115 (+),score=30.02 gnl/TRDRNA2_/TRDRNA2_132549_c0_seq1:82-426(+)